MGGTRVVETRKKTLRQLGSPEFQELVSLTEHRLGRDAPFGTR
jgi:hypothetical protein